MSYQTLSNLVNARIFPARAKAEQSLKDAAETCERAATRAAEARERATTRTTESRERAAARVDRAARTAKTGGGGRDGGSREMVVRVRAEGLAQGEELAESLKARAGVLFADF